ncbi:glycosyltransferase family 4 protein [Echinicola jeungdonensis]|uniref:Glycosyltransferase family 4 protein n=1 Tax=Echinicola jeungdonensis TaxID=709343 RepID=A0ABV5J8L2_9BACT|nr:glycosyltransferase family 4 protein [Echinicola jeungdonensis]MDN3669219.1 glycosyltransferase family 4 protein [Echinicola jeungdonensis]
MKVIYIHQYFVTPREGGAVRSYHLAKGLVDAGIEVEMITAHNNPEYDFKVIEGIKVHYLPVAYDNSFGFFRRSYAFFSFVHLAKQLIKKLPRPDLLYITSTPLTTGFIGLWAKKKFALPYIFEVRDLWPEAPIQVGAIQNRFLKWRLYHLEAKIYRHALQIVALSPGIRQYIQKKSPQASINLIPNFADTSFFDPAMAKGDKILKVLGWDTKKLTIAYTGAIGDVNAVEELLTLAMEAKRKNKNWQFAIMGKGKNLFSLQQKAKKMELEHLVFLPFGNKGEVRELLSLTDLAFISFDHWPVLQTNSPNKFFDSLAMGNAILVNQKGWLNELVKSHQIGYYFDINKMDLLIDQLERLEKDKKMLQGMKNRSRNLAELYFSKELTVKKLLFTIAPQKYPRPAIDEVYNLTG